MKQSHPNRHGKYPIYEYIHLRNRDHVGRPIWHSILSFSRGFLSLSLPLIPPIDRPVGLSLAVRPPGPCGQSGHEAIVQNLESGAEKGRRERTRTDGGRRERERGEEKIELCFRDSLFLARKKAATRVARSLASPVPACLAQERMVVNGMKTFCGRRQNGGIGGKKHFLPRPGFPTPTDRAKSSPDHICIEWLFGWMRKKTRERNPKCGMEAIGTKALVRQGATTTVLFT